MIRNIKKIVLWLFVIMVVSFSISLMFFRNSGIAINDFTNINNNFDLNDYANMDNDINSKTKFGKDINEERNFQVSNLEEINISTVSSDITFIPEDRDDIKVHFHGIITASGEIILPELVAENQNKSLLVEIKHKNLGIIGYYSSNVKLDIYIPKTYSNDIIVKTTSGNIYLESLYIKNANLRSVSGDIEISSLYTKKSRLESTSGEIDIMDFKGELDCETISGDLSVDVRNLESNIYIHSTSGSAKIKLPESTEFYLESKSVSGDINCEFPISIEGKLNDKKISGKVGNGKNKITISTVSGNINILKK